MTMMIDAEPPMKPRRSRRVKSLGEKIIFTLRAAPFVNSSPLLPTLGRRRFKENFRPKGTPEERAADLERKHRQLGREEGGCVEFRIDLQHGLLCKAAACWLAEAEQKGYDDTVSEVIREVGLERLQAGDKNALSIVATAILDARCRDWTGD